MPNYLITVSYDGTRYEGFQIQKNNDRTIQGKLTRVLSILAEEDIQLNGSGRTDRGVHARAQYASFSCKKDLKPGDILSACKEYLPEDIQVYRARRVGPRFHARYLAVEKEYRYVLDQSPNMNIFRRAYTLHVPEVLDVKAMEEAAEYLVGTHDFTSFVSQKSKAKSPIRTLNSIRFLQEGRELSICYRGEGFLTGMARNLSGCLLAVGRGQLHPQDVKGILEARDKSVAPGILPPKGLILWDVHYDPKDLKL